MKTIISFSIFIVVFSSFFTGCEVGISPLEYDSSTTTVKTTGTVDENGDIGKITIVTPENAGELNVSIEIYGPGSEHFSVKMDKNEYGYIGEVVVNPNFVVYQDTSFTFYARTIVNGQKLCAKEIQKTVKRTEVPPAAKNKSVTLDKNTQVTFPLEATDLNEDTLSYIIKVPPQHGTLTGNGNSFTYVPKPDYFGVDSFSYTANDGRDDSNLATVNMTIIDKPESDTKDRTPPIIKLNGITPMSLSLGESYIEAGATAIDAIDGNVNVVISGTVDTNRVGTYKIIYTATDIAGNTARMERVVTVLEVVILDTIPPIIDLQGGDVTLTVGDTYTELATSSDNKDGDITAHIVISGSVDTATAGAYTLTYNVQDAAGNVADTVTRIVTVNEVPDTQNPVIMLNGGDVTLTVGNPYTDAGAIAQDNVDGDITTNIQTVNNVNTNTPGIYTVTYDVNDSSGNSAVQVRRTVTVLNDTPQAFPDTYTTKEDTQIILNVLANDIDYSGVLVISIEGNATHGTIENNGTSILYRPSLNFYGEDGFSYSISDGSLTSDTVDVNITVAPVNDKPIAYSGSLTFDETNPPVGIPFELNATDVDINDTLTFIKRRVGDGNVALDPSTGKGMYTPPLGFSGTTYFKFRVKDGNGSRSNVAKISITINKLNVAPVAKDMNITVYVNENNKTIVLDGSDSNGDELSYNIYNFQPFSGGILTQGSGNIVYYEHNLSQNTMTFDYTVSDGVLTSNTATVTLINVSNIAPVAYGQNVAAVDIDTSIDITLEGNDTDGPSPITYSLVEGPSFGTLTTTDANKTYVYTPDPSYTGNDSFTFKVNDGSADSNIALVSLEINSPLAQKPYLLKWCKQNDTELWSTDGTAGNTSRLKDIYTNGSSNPEEIIDINGTYFFTAEDAEGRELWKSQGTPESTVKIKDIYAGANSSSPTHLTNVNGILYFSADDGTHGRELWKSDGTTIGTKMVKDIKYTTGNSDPSQLTDVNGVLYFSADDGDNGEELWRSDSTKEGTVLVGDIQGGTVSSSPHELTNVNGVLFFVANDGKRTDNYGIIDDTYSLADLWKVDSITGDVKQVRSFENLDIFFTFERPPENLFDHNGILVFTGFTRGTGQELWRSDGTLNGTSITEDFAGSIGSHPKLFVSVGGVLYFTSDIGITNTEHHLKKVDDISVGTITTNFNYLNLDEYHAGDPENLRAVNSGVFFNNYYEQRDDDGNVIEAWTYLWHAKGNNVTLIDSYGSYRDKPTIYTYDGLDANRLLFRVTNQRGTESSLKVTNGGTPLVLTTGCGL